MNKSEIAERERLVAELKAARTAWHESHGVPISWEYARFLDAIGNLTDFMESAERAIAESQAPQPELLEALRRYGKHLTGCACLDEEGEPKVCDCGFGKIQARL